MVITPMLTKQLPIEVPQKAELDEPPDVVKDQLFIRLFADGRIELNQKEVTLEGLEEKLTAKLSGRSSKERVVFFDGENDVAYGNAVIVMDLAKGAGAETIGMVTPREGELDGTQSIEGVPPEGAVSPPAAATE